MNAVNALREPAWFSFPKQGVLPFDPWLLGPAIALVLTGFVMITSASMDVAAEKFGGPFFFAARHGFFILLAMVASIVAVRIPIKYWEKYGPILLGVGFVLLILVLIPGIGREVNGSRRWISLGLLNLQASEIAKFCMVIYVAGYLVRRLSEVRSSWGGVVKPVLPLAFFVSLLLVEPDYGAAVVLMGSVMGMIFLGGMRFAQFLMVLLCAVGMIVVMAVAQPYRMARLKSFQDPWADPFGSGYQLSQAQIAFGRGEWFGTGLGNSVQKLFYLPEAHTDFVYSVLAEEFGLVGALLVVIIYGIMICRIFIIGRQAEKQQQFFMGYITYGFGLIFAAQALINIGVNVGALPTKGLTLPLVSYGGSSLLVCSVMIAIILRVDYELKKLRIAGPEMTASVGTSETVSKSAKRMPNKTANKTSKKPPSSIPIRGSHEK
ncbi:putative lipid II flippase FtsW [Neptunomonas antarctica]|uniref:Probable peptidoglycan glycosyltransferase FtsW n=1 Tax=Neptunomonas antarctica TaxID=619304 RepID=A0A1N7PFX2_9GAMM|nr:putative lipid II flippase FtsW [Neptunomonas antarctica]SIT09492.1 cell division-specific peptidoglycan biosynthesis regulator FtsW [Neptunomonas antarctica]